MQAKKQHLQEHCSHDVVGASFADCASPEDVMFDAILHKPLINTVADFRRLDDGEVLEGYLDGVHGGPWPEPERSRSYRHGWRNGMIDRFGLPADDATRLLQSDFDRLR